MSQQLALGLTALGLVVGYFLLVLRVSRALARFLTNTLVKKDRPNIVDEDTGIEIHPDDELVDGEFVDTPTGKVWRSYSRGEARFRAWFYLLIFPLMLYLHYKLWDELVAGFEWTFQLISEWIISIFYRG